MKYVFVTLLVIFSNIAFAGGTTGTFKIGELKVGEDGIRIHADGGFWNDADQCSGSNTTNRVFLLDTTQGYEEIYSGILAYKMADKPVTFYVSGCVTVNGVNFPSVKVVYL